MRVSPHHRSIRTRLAFPLVGLMIASLGCGLGSVSPTATVQPTEPLVRPTQAEVPTATQATRPLVKPTSASAPAEQPSPSGEVLPLAPDTYVHSSATFALNPPVGWELEEYDSGATWTDPSGEGRIEVFVNTTGYQLEADAVENLIAANVQNYLGLYDNYQALDRSIDNFGAIVVTQSLEDDGTLYRVTTIYYQEKDVIYEVDFWASVDRYGDFAPSFDRIWQEMGVDSGQASASIEPYSDSYTFTDPTGLFEFDVPYLWRYETSTDTYSVVDKFIAPDASAFVDNIKYDDGSQISKSLAGAFALDLLHQFYAADIKITDDKVQSDGSERLAWFSQSASYSGTSFFETRGTTFLMLTYVSNDTMTAIYSPVFDKVLATYQVP